MKIDIVFTLIFLISLAGCSENKSKSKNFNDEMITNVEENISEIEVNGDQKIIHESIISSDSIIVDSIQYIINNREDYELNLQSVYLETEKMLKNDFNIPENEIIEKMQLLIDDGALVSPHIINPKTFEVTQMNYKEYKDYRKRNPLDSLNE